MIELTYFDIPATTFVGIPPEAEYGLVFKSEKEYLAFEQTVELPIQRVHVASSRSRFKDNIYTSYIFSSHLQKNTLSLNTTKLKNTRICMSVNSPVCGNESQFNFDYNLGQSIDVSHLVNTIGDCLLHSEVYKAHKEFIDDKLKDYLLLHFELVHRQ